MLFHEANVFPVEFSDDRALCFRFTFGQLGLAWEPEACTSTHSSAEEEMFGRGFQTAGEREERQGSSSAGAAPGELMLLHLRGFGALPVRFQGRKSLERVCSRLLPATPSACQALIRCLFFL